MAGLTPQRRVFVEEYLSCWDKTEAARRAGYKHPGQMGYQLLQNASIAELVEKRIADKAMSADEVLLRLAEQARGSVSAFLDVDSRGELVGFDFSDDKPLHLLKKATITETEFAGTTRRTVAIEVLDPQAALIQLGRHHKLFTDKVEHTGDPNKPVVVQVLRGVSMDDL